MKKSIMYFLIFMFSIALAYAVSTSLTSPTNNFIDDDGNLDLRGSCAPTDPDGTTQYNITNATLYSNVDGTWKANKTLDVTTSLTNLTYFFNFTNDINSTAEGTFQWNIQCNEQNATGEEINKAFAGNRTIQVAYANPTIATTSPNDGTYSLDGVSTDVVCTASPSGGWNISAVSLLHDSGNGGWGINSTFSPVMAAGVEIVANFTIENQTDGKDVVFGCSATQVKALDGLAPTSSEKSSANRTLNVEFPPETTLNGPTDNSWSQTKVTNLSWTTLTTTDSGTILTRLWTNESGIWAPRTGTIEVTNNTQKDYNYDFDEGTAIRWTIEAIQYNDANVKNKSVNRTINIDATNPSISVGTGNLLTSDNTPEILATITDTNIVSAELFANFSADGTWLKNFSNSSLVSGLEANYFNSSDGALVDGVYKYSINATDSAGNSAQSANYSLTIDTTAPTISAITNVSVTGKCDQRAITFTTSEITTANMTYDTDSDSSDGSVISTSTETTSHSLVLDFDYNGEITYYFNITVADLAGNVNDPIVADQILQTPARVCAGWSQYAIYNATTLGEIQNSSGADLVYIWNASNQNWVFKTAGLTTNDNVDVGTGTDYHVVHLFEDTNDTWYRNTVNQGVYDFNVTSTNNFLSVPTDYTFGNLTESFMNETITQTSNKFVPFPSTNGTFVWNITLFSGYNNSLQDYVASIFNFTWANSTVLEPCPDRVNTETCMETFWVASDFNLTWNGAYAFKDWS